MSEFFSRLRFFFRREPSGELDEELQFHLEQATQANIAAGMTPEEARRQARIEFGGVESAREQTYAQRPGWWVETVLQDVRFGLRQLRRNRGFTLTAVITLGLGIGATTAIFSAVYALLLRPLPYPSPNRLVYVFQTWPKRNWTPSPMISQDFVAAQSTLKSFQSIAGFEDRGDRNLTGKGNPIRVKVVLITASLLPTLGIVPHPGRNFLKSEDRAAGPPVVLLSHRLWESEFHGDPSFVGRTVTIDGKIQTVVGVLPAQFLFPDPGIEPDVYAPADFDPETSISIHSEVFSVNAIARLRDGFSASQALAELQAFAGARAKGYGAILGDFADGRRIMIEPLQHYLTGDDRRSLLLLLACVGAVLLIACANVANMQLARAMARQHETAVRGALGATRRRLVRQFLIESLTLATLATSVGLAIAFTATCLIRQGGMPGEMAGTSQVARLIRPPFGKLGAAVQVDGGVLLFIAALVLVTTILSGMAPAISGSRTDLRTGLQGTALRISAGREQRFFRHGLLIAEIGMGVALLAAASMLIRSFANELDKDSGFDTNQTLTGVLQLDGYTPNSTITNLVRQLLPRLQAIPGVSAAAVTSALPLDETPCPNTMVAFGEGPLPPESERKGGCVISITPDYFRAAGTLVLKGRSFNDADNAKSVPVAIVNRDFARLYFKGNALGQRFRTNILAKDHATDYTERTVVGIVQDVHYNGLDEGVEPEIYLPIDQVPQPKLNLLLRSKVEPASLASAMRRAVLAVDSQQALFDVETMDERVSDVVAPRRLIMLLIACFALLAAVLSAVGVYGVFAYSVTQRSQEMGIRLALGSSRSEILQLFLIQAARLIALGGILGVVAALALSRLVASLLVGVTPQDMVSYLLAWALMAVVALAATLIPARRAMYVDPMVALRHE
jgi:putative ABC transport system permease protein